MKTIDVLFACNYSIDTVTLKKIRRMEVFFPNTKFVYHVSLQGLESVDIHKLSTNLNAHELSSELFDFSRYSDFLWNHSKAKITILLNDTLGTGRKFNLGLQLHFLISILLLKCKLITISGPLDRDHNRNWLSPYFLIGNTENLKALNWADWVYAKSQMSIDELENIEIWMSEKWRSRHNASNAQIEIKRKVLLLERALLAKCAKPEKIFAFGKRNPLRWLNSLNL